MTKPNTVITKFCYVFESEKATQNHIENVFGGMDDLWDSAEKAQSEMHWEQMENSHWFKHMETELGEAHIVAVDFVDGKVVGSRRVVV